jgi:toxin ParE1/3/4
MPRIIRRERAFDDLLDIYDYIAEQAGEVRAAAFIRRIEQKLALVAEYPHMGRQRDELHNGLRSFVVGRYIAFYSAIDGGIDLVRVLYGGRDIPTIFADEDV